MSELADVRPNPAPIAAPAGPRSLPLASKARLAAEIVASYVWIRWLLRRLDLPAVLAKLRSVPRASRRAPLLDGRADGVRLGAAVVRTLAPLPADTRCLMRSLVLTRLLARRGVSSSLVIAVRPEERDSLAAHAWIELDGRPLLAPAGDDHGRLVTL